MAAGEDLAPVSLADIKLDQRLIEFLRSEWGIEELFPPQQEALPYSLAVGIVSIKFLPDREYGSASC